MKQIVLLVLVFIGLALAQTSPTCLDGSGLAIGPFANALTANETQVFYSHGTPCITCEIDCMAVIQYDDGTAKNPFGSCPCRYVRYGCAAHQSCVSLQSATPRQWEAALELCMSYGCQLVSNVKPSNVYSTFSYGQTQWTNVWQKCYNAKKNGNGYALKQNYYNALNVNDGANTVNGDATLIAARSCELNQYKANYLSTNPAATNPMGDRKALQAAYQYANSVIDIAAPFLVYQYNLFSKYSLDDFKNTTKKSEVLSNLYNRLMNIPIELRTRSALFRVTDAEISNLFDQQAVCGAGKTRSDAFFDIIDKFIISLNYSSDCTKETGNPLYVEYYFDAQYKQLLNSLNIQINSVYSAGDGGRNFIYPFLFYTNSASNIQMLGSISSASTYGDGIVNFTKVSSTCPTFASLPGCVKRAIIRASGQ